MLEKFNYKRNANIDVGDGLLNGQGREPLASCRYGLFPMSYNGCEIIAARNLGIMLGNKKPLCEIAREIYPYGSALCGLLGTSPYALKRYFSENGFKTHMNKDYYTFKKRFRNKKYGVISFWNGDVIFKGLHTVALENSKDGISVCNCTNKGETPKVFDRLDDYVSPERFICGYYVDIEK